MSEVLRGLFLKRLHEFCFHTSLLMSLPSNFGCSMAVLHCQISSQEALGIMAPRNLLDSESEKEEARLAQIKFQ